MSRNAFDDDDKILKDGERVRVPMTMRDSLTPLQQSVADSAKTRISGVPCSRPPTASTQPI